MNVQRQSFVGREGNANPTQGRGNKYRNNNAPMKMNIGMWLHCGDPCIALMCSVIAGEEMMLKKNLSLS